MNADEPVVSYSVKDILARIEGKLDAVTGAITQRLDAHDVRLKDLETEFQHRKSRQDERRFLIGAITATCIALGSILTIVHPW